MPGNAPAGQQRPAVDAPGSEVSLGEILEHRLLQLGFCQKLFQPGVLLLQLSQPFGFLSLNAPVLLFPAVVGRLGYLNRPADVGDSLALSDQLLSGWLPDTTARPVATERISPDWVGR